MYKVIRTYMIYKTNENDKKELMFIKIKLCVSLNFFFQIDVIVGFFLIY
jgi:hypothetical protein